VMHDTELGPGYSKRVGSAWASLGAVSQGTVLRIQAEGLTAEADSYPFGAPSWFLNLRPGRSVSSECTECV
jgi:hypothetical protein